MQIDLVRPVDLSCYLAGSAFTSSSFLAPPRRTWKVVLVHEPMLRSFSGTCHAHVVVRRNQSRRRDREADIGQQEDHLFLQPGKSLGSMGQFWRCTHLSEGLFKMDLMSKYAWSKPKTLRQGLYLTCHKMNSTVSWYLRWIYQFHHRYPHLSQYTMNGKLLYMPCCIIKSEKRLVAFDVVNYERTEESSLMPIIDKIL